MKRLEFSGAVRPLLWSLGVKGLRKVEPPSKPRAVLLNAAFRLDVVQLTLDPTLSDVDLQTGSKLS